MSLENIGLQKMGMGLERTWARDNVSEEHGPIEHIHLEHELKA